VDRLDTWLNAQRGWRRFTLLMLQIGPGAVLLAFCVVRVSGPSLPPLGLAFAGVVALGLVTHRPNGTDSTTACWILPFSFSFPACSSC
jgi:hypothetical protein